MELVSWVPVLWSGSLTNVWVPFKWSWYLCVRTMECTFHRHVSAPSWYLVCLSYGACLSQAHGASLNGARILCIYPMEHATYKYVTYLWEARSIRQTHKIIFPSSGLRPNMTLASLKLLKTNPCEDLEN